MNSKQRARIAKFLRAAAEGAIIKSVGEHTEVRMLKAEDRDYVLGLIDRLEDGMTDQWRERVLDAANRVGGVKVGNDALVLVEEGDEATSKLEDYWVEAWVRVPGRSVRPS